MSAGRRTRGGQSQRFVSPAAGLATAVALVAAVAAAMPAWSQTKGSSGQETVDHAVAWIGDTPIYRSEVEERAQMAAMELQITVADTADYRRLHREVLDGLVQDQLIQLEAKAQGITVDNAEVEAAVEETMQEMIGQVGGPESFREQLKARGLTEAELRADYREEARKVLVARRLVQKEVGPRVTTTEADARLFYEQNREQLPKKPRALRVRDIFFRTRPDSVLEARVRDRALEVRGKILGGLAFDEAARRYSDDPKASESPRMGRVARESMDHEMATTVLSLPLNEVSPPVRTRLGFHLFKVTARDPEGTWADLDHVLFEVAVSKIDQEAARDRAEEVLGRIRSGEIGFLEAVRRYSEDPESRARDGDMNWIPYDNFYGEMKTAVQTARVGEVVGPAAGEGGYHVFKIEAEQAEGMYAYEDIQEEIAQLASQQAQQQEIQTWIDGLRKKYFVDVQSPW